MTEVDKGGRPPEYDEDELVELSEEYIKQCIDTVVNGKKKVKLPKVAGLILYFYEHMEQAPNKTYIYTLAKKMPKFSEILDRLNSLQEERVIDEALAGNYNANIAKLLLGKHGYKDEAKTEHTGGIALTQLFDKSNE